MKIFLEKFLFMLACLFGQFTLSTPGSTTQDPYHRMVSHGKPASQSSTEGSHVASLATDGNFNDIETECAKTTISDDPYLEIDLEKDTRASFVSLVLFSEIEKIEDITVSSTNEAGKTVVHLKDERKSKFVTSISRKARFVRISLSGTGRQLAVCEMAVYFAPVETIADHKPTRSSGHLYGGGDHKVVDQDYVLSRFRSKLRRDPWMRIDLLDIYLVQEIFIVSALMDTDYGPATNLNVRIGMSLENEGRSNALCAIGSLWVGEAKSFFCAIFGQYITIHRPTVKSEMLIITEASVNTDNTESVEFKEVITNVQQASSSQSIFKMFDKSLFTEFVSKSHLGEKHISIDLGEQYDIAVVYIVANNLIQFELKLGIGTTYDELSHCIPGRHNMPKYSTEYFFCEKTITAKSIKLRQYRDDVTTLQIYEVLAFEKIKPIINYKTSDKYVWAEEAKDITLSCDIKGSPTPVFSWVKNKTIMASGSSSLTLRRVSQNQSGTYECWGNNTHGFNAKQVELAVASDLRVCAKHEEMTFDMKTSTVVKDFEIRGDQWYSIFDQTAMKYFQFRKRAPKTTSCQVWLKGKHPKLSDRIVHRTLCIKNETHGCPATIDVNIRRCSVYYVYNFGSLREMTSTYKFCFEPAVISTSGQFPAISLPTANYALSGKIFQTEYEVEESHCLLMCHMVPKCKSFNFSKKHKICELNTAKKKDFPKNYGRRSDYSYYQMNTGTVRIVRKGEL